MDLQAGTYRGGKIQEGLRAQRALVQEFCLTPEPLSLSSHGSCAVETRRLLDESKGPKKERIGGLEKLDFLGDRLTKSGVGRRCSGRVGGGDRSG